MLMQTGWIQASRRVTRRLAWDPTCLPLSLSLPTKNKQNLQVLKSRRQYNLFLENYPAFKGLKNACHVSMHFSTHTHMDITIQDRPKHCVYTSRMHYTLVYDISIGKQRKFWSGRILQCLQQELLQELPNLGILCLQWQFTLTHSVLRHFYW